MKKSLSLSLVLMLVGAPVLAAEEAGGGPLEVNGGLVIWTLIVFALLFAVLRKFAWPAILGAVEAREQALERQLAEAEKNRSDSAALLAEHKKLIAEARSGAQGLLAEAKVAAEKERTAILEKTRQEQDELLDRVRRDIAAERDKALVEIRREAVDISLAAAGRLVGERFTSDADRALVSRYLSSVEKAN
jgi:F-type H+-transporting ATPase subunit b